MEVPPSNVTVVRTAGDLQRATLTGALDIEIRTHLDLRTLAPADNPELQGAGEAAQASALLYVASTLRSIRVRIQAFRAICRFFLLRVGRLDPCGDRRHHLYSDHIQKALIL